MALIKRIISIFLILIVAIPSVAFALEDKVIAYYFHGSFRCPTCHKLEEYSKDAINTSFKDEIENGSLEFKTVNVEEKENENFVQEYKLYTKSLVLSKVKDGKEVEYKNLDKIWECVGDKKKFYDYIISETKDFLKDKE